MIDKLKSWFYHKLSDFSSRVIHHQAFDPAQLEITYLTITSPDLAASFDGYRLVQISDIHLGTWVNSERLINIVKIINGLSADLVVITGDFVADFFPEALDLLPSALLSLQPKDGVLAVRGNHDYRVALQRFSDTIAKSGIVNISNAIYTIQRDNNFLYIAGVDTVRNKQDRLDIVLKQLPQQGAAILLSHEPDFADISAKTGRFFLQLSGHSHGGQINLPLLGSPLLPKLGKKYPKGFYIVDGMIQYTNRGIGTAYLQLRYNCPSEITVFTLKSA